MIMRLVERAPRRARPTPGAYVGFSASAVGTPPRHVAAYGSPWRLVNLASTAAWPQGLDEVVCGGVSDVMRRRIDENTGGEALKRRLVDEGWLWRR